MKILVTGAAGQIGRHLIPLLATSEHTFIAPTRQELDITDLVHTELAITRYAPDLVINLAAYTAVDLAETNGDQAFAVNHLGAGNLSKAAAMVDAAIIHLSTDYVFSGCKTSPYTESDTPDPINAYGRSKLAGELAIAKANSRHLILRTAWVFSDESKNFYTTMLQLAEKQTSISVVNDQYGSPTYANDVALAIVALINQLEQMNASDWGVYHYAGYPCTTWFEMATEIFSYRRPYRQAPKFTPIKSAQYKSIAKRPSNSCLSTKKFTERFFIEPSDWRKCIKDLAYSPGSTSYR